MNHKVTQDTMAILEAIDSSLSDAEKDALRKHIESLPDDVKRKVAGYQPTGSDLEAMKRGGEGLSQQDEGNVRQHLEKLPHELKKKITDSFKHTKKSS